VLIVGKGRIDDQFVNSRFRLRGQMTGGDLTNGTVTGYSPG
jgi:hypothetical protein